MHEVDQNMTDELRESFPDYCEEVETTLDQCDILLDEAFVHGEDREERRMMASNFLNRLGVLKSNLEDPTPGAAFAINTTLVSAALDALNKAIYKNFRVRAQSSDDDSPGFAMH